MTENEAKRTKPPRTGMKRSRVNPRSEKLTDAMAEYGEARAAYLVTHKTCEIKARGCGKWGREIHHKAGRIGPALVDPENFAACCRPCHAYTHEHGTWARANGWIVRHTGPVRKGIASE